VPLCSSCAREDVEKGLIGWAEQWSKAVKISDGKNAQGHTKLNVEVNSQTTNVACNK
jgi:hypothetical protein